MAREEETKQGVIKELTSAAGAVQAIFPELEIARQKQTVLFLESLSPNPIERKELLFLRVGELSRGAFTGMARDVSKTVFEVGLSDFSHKEELEKTGGVVIFVSRERLAEAVQTSETIVDSLAPNVGVWLIEDSLPSISDRQLRIDALEALGLAARKVVQKGNFCVSYGRTEKDRHSTATDLTTRPYFAHMLAQAKESLLADGWTNVSFEEAIERCRQSRNPPVDLGNVKLGFGVEAAAPCGCRWHVDLRGDYERLWQCSPDCEGESWKLPRQEQKRKPFLVGSDIPSSEATGKKLSCDWCQAELLFDRRVIESKDGKTNVQSDLKCPHCGLKGTREVETREEIKVFERKNGRS